MGQLKRTRVARRDARTLGPKPAPNDEGQRRRWEQPAEGEPLYGDPGDDDHLPEPQPEDAPSQGYGRAT